MRKYPKRYSYLASACLGLMGLLLAPSVASAATNDPAEGEKATSEVSENSEQPASDATEAVSLPDSEKVTPDVDSQANSDDDTQASTNNGLAADEEFVIAELTDPAGETEVIVVSRLHGIDISHHQPAHVAATVPADFVIIKASEGDGWRDPNFTAAYEKAKAAGRLVGAYHFSRADLNNTAEAEADWFLTVVGDRVGETLLVLDHETKSQAVGGAEWALQFLDRVYETSQVRPVIYGSRNAMCSKEYANVAAEYELWIAHYLTNKRTDYLVDANRRHVNLGFRQRFINMPKWANSMAMKASWTLTCFSAAKRIGWPSRNLQHLEQVKTTAPK